MSSRPIGIFDSGVGGLTVARQIFYHLPREEVIYFGDTARVPYGNKSPQTVTRFATEIVNFLLTQRVKLTIVACNTTSAFSLNFLKKNFSLPMLGVIEAGVSAALRLTRNKRIGVIGTEGTIRSGAYKRLIKKRSPGMEVFSRACPLLVPLVEEGWLKEPVTEQIARQYLAPLLKKNIDTLILGCTHYPLLKPVFKKIIAEEVTSNPVRDLSLNGANGVNLVDSGEAVAEITGQVLAELNLLSKNRGKIKHKFFVTDAPGKFIRIGQRFLGASLANVKKVTLG